MKKQGIIKVSFELLAKALNLDKSVEVEAVFTTYDDMKRNTFSVKVKGEHPNLIEAYEGGLVAELKILDITEVPDD